MSSKQIDVVEPLSLYEKLFSDHNPILKGLGTQDFCSKLDVGFQIYDKLDVGFLPEFKIVGRQIRCRLPADGRNKPQTLRSKIMLLEISSRRSFPQPKDIFIFPRSLISKSPGDSEKAFMLGILETRNQILRPFVRLINIKGKK